MQYKIWFLQGDFKFFHIIFLSLQIFVTSFTENSEWLEIFKIREEMLR